MQSNYSVFKAQDNLCVVRMNFCDKKTERIPFIWLCIGFIICEFVICELCLGRIFAYNEVRLYLKSKFRKAACITFVWKNKLLAWRCWWNWYHFSWNFGFAQFYFFLLNKSFSDGFELHWIFPKQSWRVKQYLAFIVKQIEIPNKV